MFLTCLIETENKKSEKDVETYETSIIETVSVCSIHDSKKREKLTKKI